jgi:hypothetical protein
MNLHLLAAASFLATALLCSNGCGGATYVGELPADGGNGGNRGDGGNGGDAATLPDGQSTPTGEGCPLARPSADSPCTTEGLGCPYGQNHTGCDSDSAECSGGKWVVFATPACPPAGGDGGTSPDGGTQCETHGGTCTFDDGTGLTDVCTGLGHKLSNYPCAVGANKIVCCLP